MVEFHLEKAIAVWRKSLAYNQAFHDEDLVELETHLRDHVDELVASGIDEKEAFERGLRRLGGRREMESEFRKTRWGKRRRRQSMRTWLRWNAAVQASYIVTSARNIRRHGIYSAISVGGLVLGLASPAS